MKKSADLKHDVVTTCRVLDLGIIGYREAYDIQKQCVDDVINGNSPCLLLCEHPPVVTLGRLSHPENLLISKEELASKKVEVIKIDRGGDITLHAPGQLVVYPILNLTYDGKDLHLYLRKLEQVVIDLLRDFGIVANRLNGKTGVWVGDLKLASLGIGVRQWVSYHGIGINVNTDLNLFKMMNPCGLYVSMTSIAEIRGLVQDMDQVKEIFVKHFFEHFHFNKEE